MQNSVLQKFISDSVAFESGKQGSVTVFTYEGDIEKALEINGFSQCTSKDSAQFGTEYKTNQFFSEQTGECVFLGYGNDKTFTLTDTDCECI